MRARGGKVGHKKGSTHVNVIVNGGKATARDVLELIAILQQRAKNERGIDLQTEVEIIGE